MSTTPVSEELSAPIVLCKSKWTYEKVARLGLLIGLGWDSKRIAKDPLIRSTEHSVQRQASRFCLSLPGAQSEGSIRLPVHVLRTFDKAAQKRRITPEVLIRVLFITMTSEPGLLDNILDDRN